MSAPAEPAVPILPGTPIAKAPPANCPRLVAEAEAASVADAMRRTNYPAENPEFLEALEAQAQARIEAAIAPGIDPEKSLVDRWAVDAVPSLAERANRAERAHDVSLMGHQQIADRLASTPRPMRLWASLVWVVALVGLAAVTTYGVVELLKGGVDLFLLRHYNTATYGTSGKAFSASSATNASMCIVAALAFGQVIAVLLTWGRMHWSWKIAFVVVEVIFTLAFGKLRMIDGGSAEAWAAGGFEVAPLLALTVAVCVASAFLKGDAEARAPYRLAATALKNASAGMERAEARLAKARGELAAQVAALEVRDFDRRGLPALRELAAATVRVEVMTELAAMISKSAETPAEDALTAHLEAELAAEAEQNRELVKAGRPS